MPDQPKNLVERLFVCAPNHSGMIQEKHYLCMYQLMHRIGALGRDVNVCVEGHTIVHTARQAIVAQALASEECTHLLWVDDDMVFTPEQYMALEAELVMNDLDFISGLCFSNSTPTKPCVFGRVNRHPEFGEKPWWSIMSDYPGVEREVITNDGVEVIKPWGEHRRFRVYASGFGFCLMTKRMLDGMRRDEHGDIIEGYHHFYNKHMHNLPNEDVAFCINAGKAGYKLYADSRVTIGHIQREQHVINEETYIGHGESVEYMSNMERFRFADDEEVDAVPADLPKEVLSELNR